MEGSFERVAQHLERSNIYVSTLVLQYFETHHTLSEVFDMGYPVS